ncbi:type II secretion system protein GspG [Candidatus Babeliales bacterium]|nr:type II secretion system protein GspG [Candidatus Babeliales bacterium]
MTYKNNNLQPGFNFIEMMVALVIIGIIAGLIGPRVMGLLGRGRSTATANTLKVVKDALKNYKIDVGTYPAALVDLVKKSENASGWQGPYVGDEDKNAELPKDAWGQDLVYKLNEKGINPPFELYSLGDPDKEDARIYAK